MVTTHTPRWLEAYTTTSGLPDPRLAGTSARPRHCRTCGRLILAGYDAPSAAALATADPYLLTRQLEAAAVILDIPTYQLWGTPGHYELTPRHEPGQPPECNRAPAGNDVRVLAAHRCAFPPLSRTDITTPATRRPTHDNPPY